MKTLTVFTPTFNRAYCLHKLYDSLCAQSSTDFEWLIIDDGSTDNTKDLVQAWVEKNKIKIIYVFKDNGGMHTGHNKALDLIDTELNVCVDSDDYMAYNAVELIVNFWQENKTNKYAGILGLNTYTNGQLVSNKKFPEGVKGGKYSELKNKYGIVRDVKFVYSTEIIKKYSGYPAFENEKFTPLGYKYAMIDQDYDMLFLNEVLCVVEYMDDGSTVNMYKQYYNNPKGFAYSRKMSFLKSYTIKEKFVTGVHLAAESMLAKQNPFKENPSKVLTAVAIPLGFALYLYINYLNRK